MNNLKFFNQIEDLLDMPAVRAMEGMHHHGAVDCLDHCLFVSYVGFAMCRALGLDSRAAARGGLLHDLYLYNKNAPRGEWHLFAHPKAALRNARTLCPLSRREQDIIGQHMWPLSSRWPRYAETYVVGLADKLCALAELLGIYQRLKIGRTLDACK